MRGSTSIVEPSAIRLKRADELTHHHPGKICGMRKGGNYDISSVGREIVVSTA